MRWFIPNFSNEDQTPLLHRKINRVESYEPGITIKVTVCRGNVKIQVHQQSPNVTVEDKRITDFIEQKIKEGFASYHKDKTDKSIDI